MQIGFTIMTILKVSRDILLSMKDEIGGKKHCSNHTMKTTKNGTTEDMNMSRRNI